MPSLRIASSPERTALRATHVALRAAAVWNKAVDPSAQRSAYAARSQDHRCRLQAEAGLGSSSAIGAAWIEREQW